MAQLQVEKAGGLLGVTPRGLCILMILLIIIVVMFIVLIVLAALWPRRYGSDAPIICTTPACLRAAAQVINNLQFNHGSFTIDDPIDEKERKTEIE